ncbi:MAG: TIGR00730 family Rossman fold protein [Proteobacteria bacterium]|nr:TIGR00730 family Rossman fold protein [Pseudomonadota bacterium]
MNEMTKMPVPKPANDMNGGNPPTAAKIDGVCVYCGSGKGLESAYAIAARKLGKALADNGIRLVYGGGSLGLMGEVARATLGAGGKVTGIIPEFLGSREHMLKDVDELIVVENMHVRKQLMFDRADAFVALPGGVGTLEELVEQLTWSQLGRHSKPIIVANINGFWDPFLKLLEHMKAETFIRAGLDVHFTVVDKAEDILPAILKSAGLTTAEKEQELLEKF